VLSQAIEAPMRPSQRELASRMGIGGATLVRHLDRLEAEGLVIRRRDDHDRRVTRVDITPAGRARHRDLAHVADRFEREIQALMSDEEVEILRSILQRLGQFAVAAPRPSPSPAAEPERLAEETDVA
jgi:DNA-binding MarR family transcriptional regulator